MCLHPSQSILLDVLVSKTAVENISIEYDFSRVFHCLYLFRSRNPSLNWDLYQQLSSTLSCHLYLQHRCWLRWQAGPFNTLKSNQKIFMWKLFTGEISHWKRWDWIKILCSNTTFNPNHKLTSTMSFLSLEAAIANDVLLSKSVASTLAPLASRTFQNVESNSENIKKKNIH